MARYTGPACRLCRASNCKLFLKGERCFSDKCSFEKRKTRPGHHGAAAKKMTEYAVQLREKQKVKSVYGLLERQFYKLYEEASNKRGVTGTLLLEYLERRLDNVAFRLGLAKSRTQARQVVRHGHILINGKRVDIPSYRIKAGDVITLKEGSKEVSTIKESIENARIPAWLEFNKESLTGKVLTIPPREALDLDVKEQLIVEFYSR